MSQRHTGAVSSLTPRPAGLLMFSILLVPPLSIFFFFNDTATTEIYTLSLHDALPILEFAVVCAHKQTAQELSKTRTANRSEEHTSELQSRLHLVCRLLLEKKKKYKQHTPASHRHNNKAPLCR